MWLAMNINVEFWPNFWTQIIVNLLNRYKNVAIHTQKARFKWPTWGLPRSRVPHVGPMNLAIRVVLSTLKKGLWYEFDRDDKLIYNFLIARTFCVCCGVVTFDLIPILQSYFTGARGSHVFALPPVKQPSKYGEINFKMMTREDWKMTL